MSTRKITPSKKKVGGKKKMLKGSGDFEVAKGPWKKEEDRLLLKLVEEFGAKDWSSIATQMANVGVIRKGKQCRERWYNHLSPDVRKDAWTSEEDEIIIKAHIELGNKWTEISRMLDGRPANAIKNHWNATLKRKLDAAGKLNVKISPSSSISRKKRKRDNYEEDEEEETIPKHKREDVGSITPRRASPRLRKNDFLISSTKSPGEIYQENFHSSSSPGNYYYQKDVEISSKSHIKNNQKDRENFHILSPGNYQKDGEIYQNSSMLSSTQNNHQKVGENYSIQQQHSVDSFQSFLSPELTPKDSLFSVDNNYNHFNFVEYEDEMYPTHCTPVYIDDDDEEMIMIPTNSFILDPLEGCSKWNYNEVSWYDIDDRNWPSSSLNSTSWWSEGISRREKLC